jgi:hypothetical protein
MNTPSASLYQQALGPAFDALPASLRALHGLSQSAVFRGEAEVIAAQHVIGRLIARLTGFPTRSYRCPVEVRIDVDAEGETWHRDFGGHRFNSRMRCLEGQLHEQLGPHRIRFALDTNSHGLSMRPIAWRTFGIPLPGWLWPQLSARETESEGRFQFDVATAFPFIGTVIHYRGWLSVADRNSS